jgi:hypothetical protein
VWKSEGYGNVYEIRGSEFRAFEVTTNTCVPGIKATGVPGKEATFKGANRDVFSIAEGNDADHKSLRRPEGLYQIALQRIEKLPTVCASLTPNTPMGNFEVFTSTFREHYIAFSGRHVDWEKLVSENRVKVTPNTTPVQLFEILDSMIKPLGDLHTDIEARALKRESKEPLRAGTDRVVKNGIENFATKGRRELSAITDKAWLAGPTKSYCRGQIRFGHFKDGTGYMRILGFGGYARFGGDKRALESALDAIFSDRSLKALVIDVRLSFGGDDGLGLSIASRLTRAEYLAYAIQARSDPAVADRWTSADRVLVRPSSRPSFRGPVIELIGPITMSAAETFSQALMGRTPNVIRIGQNTQGLFCDSLDRHLPNGWTFALPNAIYRTADGVAFDVEGIPPDIEVRVFDDGDVAAREDPAMGMALRVLSGKTN